MLNSSKCAGLVLAAVLLACYAGHQQTSGLSIEPSDPHTAVKVTHKNSGPSYDIDLRSNEAESSNDDASEEKRVVDKPASEPVRPVAVGPAMFGGAQEGEMPTLGRLTVQRIFLPVAVVAPTASESNSDERPSLAPPEFPRLHHIFGADQASRPPMEREGERARDNGREGEPMIDPVRMMLDLIHQAVNLRLSAMAESEANANGTDLSKADSAPDQARPVTLDRAPVESKNETKEEIVEIEGKKYLKKSVVNRHVGKNIIYMTRRLIFVPLNETDEAPSSTRRPELEATTTTMSTSSTSAPESGTSSEPTTIGVAPTSDQPAVEPAVSTTTKARETEETTSTTEGTTLIERASEAIEKAAERLVKMANKTDEASPAPAPAATTTATAPSS